MRCRDITTDVKYEIKGRMHFGNFMIIDDIQPEDVPGLLLLAGSTALDAKSKQHLQEVTRHGDSVNDSIWLVSVDLSVMIIRFQVQRPEVFNPHSPYTNIKLPYDLRGQSVGHLIKELHMLCEKEGDLFPRIFSRLPSMNGVIQQRIKLRERPFGDIFMLSKHLDMALTNPFEARDDHLSMLFVAGRTRHPEQQLEFEHAMDVLKHRQLENFRDDDGVFSTYQVSPQELSARKSRAANLLKKFVNTFPSDNVLAGLPVQWDAWEQKVKSFISELSDDELCELLLAFWMTGIQQDVRLKLLVLAVEERSRSVQW